MNNLNRYFEAINTLAGQLGKLLKVINHSDPSADTVKHVLYDKYKSTLSAMAAEIKTHTSWSSFNLYLEELKKGNRLILEDGIKEVVYRKLIKDFEDEFITRHKLAEFAAPNPENQIQKERLRRIRQQIRSNRKKQKNPLPANDIGELFRIKNREKKAKSSLDKLVKVFNNLDPKRFES